MDQESQTGLPGEVSRREALKVGLAGLACAACGGGGIYYSPGGSAAAGSAGVFHGDAPAGELWEQWQKRGWAREARHYLKLGRNIQCKLCPNECLLEPEDRGHCRNRVYKDGTLYTLAYGNPCAFHVDPIEKKPLFHFLPGTTGLLARHGRLRVPLPELPELGHFAAQAGRDRRDPRRRPIRLDGRHAQVARRPTMPAG